LESFLNFGQTQKERQVGALKGRGRGGKDADSRGKRGRVGEFVLFQKKTWFRRSNGGKCFYEKRRHKLWGKKKQIKRRGVKNTQIKKTKKQSINFGERAGEK